MGMETMNKTPEQIVAESSYHSDSSGKWVPIEDVLRLMERIRELEQQIYGSK